MTDKKIAVVMVVEESVIANKGRRVVVVVEERGKMLKGVASSTVGGREHLWLKQLHRRQLSLI